MFIPFSDLARSMSQSVGSGALLFASYLVVFGLAALACFLSVSLARQIEDPDTRRGLVALLVTSGAWATAHVAFLLAPSPQLKHWLYVAGLIVGLAAVGPWLYFCSAYTGRTLHRNPTYRRVAIALFLGIVLVKLTNPLHHVYFTSEFVTTPFPHLAVHNRLFHWLVMGLSYALAAVGYFMLFELFTQVSYDTTPLAVLAAITGLPLVLDLAGLASPLLIDITYEPIGVAVFAVGVVFLYLDRFQTVQLAGGRDEPVIVLNDEDQIREFNDSARDLFPELGARNVLGEPIDAILPSLAERLDAETSILSLEREGATRYYRVSVSPFSTGRRQLGRLLVITDITHREQYREKLEQQNERLEQFANMVSHDLRNPLNVAQGYLTLARDTHESENMEAIADALDRMEALIEDILALARQGQDIDELEGISLSTVAEWGWNAVETGDADLVVEQDITVLADPPRLQQLLENLFRNSVEHGGRGVTIRVGALDRQQGFYVVDDGPGIPEDEREQVLDSGYTTADDGTGFGLAIVEEITRAHGWEITVSESVDGGARFEITDVKRVR